MKKFIGMMSVLLVAAITMLTFASCSKTEKVKVIDIALTNESYAFGVDIDQPELLTKANEFIKKIMDDGTFKSICDKYFSDAEPTAVVSAKEDSSKDQLVVATNAEFAPFEYKDGNSFYGIDMEIAAMFAQSLGKELVIKDMAFDAVCLSVGQHKCDIAMAGLTISEDRKEHVNFTDPYYVANQKLVVAGNDDTFDNCKTTEDVEKILKGFDSKTKIGFQNGTTGQLYTEGDADWGFDGYAVEAKGYSSGALAVQDLINGNINYVIIDSDPATFIVNSLNQLA